MPRFVIGKSREDLEKEEAQFMRQREQEALKLQQEQQKQLQQFAAKEKRNRYIVLGVSAVIILALLIFGTYNTFFKKSLQIPDVQDVVGQSVVIFPETGLTGFLRDNFDSLFSQKVSYNTSDRENGLEYVKGKLDSLVIDDVKVLSRTLARVYFSIDIETKKYDTKDAVTREILPGEVSTNRWRFYLPVEQHYNKNDRGENISVGYAPVGDLSIFSLAETNTDKVVKNPAFTFNGAKVDEATLNAVQIKVEKTLRDLYDKVDTSQDFIMPRGFSKNIDAKFQQIVTFEMYNSDNAIGCNAYVTYLIQTGDGFIYNNSAYLKIEQNGTTYIITKMI
jgi:hypothetical protein